jgi:hypothetical protein
VGGIVAAWPAPRRLVQPLRESRVNDVPEGQHDHASVMVLGSEPTGHSMSVLFSPFQGGSHPPVTWISRCLWSCTTCPGLPLVTDREAELHGPRARARMGVVVFVAGRR